MAIGISLGWVWQAGVGLLRWLGGSARSVPRQCRLLDDLDARQLQDIGLRREGGRIKRSV